MNHKPNSLSRLWCALWRFIDHNRAFVVIGIIVFISMLLLYALSELGTILSWLGVMK